MKVKVYDLVPADREYKVELDRSGVNGALAGRQDLKCTGAAIGNLALSRVNSTVNVHGTITIPVTFTCSRCTEEYESDVRIRLKLTLAKAEERVPEDEDTGFGTYSGEQIDLEEICLEQVAADMPQTFICDPGCKGLCYVCGADLNQGECGCSR